MIKLEAIFRAFGLEIKSFVLRQYTASIFCYPNRVDLHHDFKA